MSKIPVVFTTYTISEKIRDITLNTIGSLLRHDISIIVVDDNSPIKPDYLSVYADKIIQRDVNGGFGACANTGLRWVLNNHNGKIVIATNDIEVRSNWLEVLSEPFDKVEKVGFSGLMTTGDRNIFQNYKGNKFTEGGVINHSVISEGLSMTTTEVLEDIGLYDEQFELGVFEDFDLLLRGQKAGYKLIMSDKSVLWHYGSATRHDESLKQRSGQTEFKNKKRFEKKWRRIYIPHLIWKENLINV